MSSIDLLIDAQNASIFLPEKLVCMSISIRLANKENALPQVHLQSLPCSIEYNGKANVCDYFKAEEIKSVKEERTTFDAAFRGRYLEGIEIKVPDGFQGYLLLISASHCVRWNYRIDYA